MEYEYEYVVLFIVLIVTGSVDVTEPSILTQFLIFDTMTENRLHLSPACRELPEGRFISRSSATNFAKLHGSVRNCKEPESQGARTPTPPKKN